MFFLICVFGLLVTVPLHLLSLKPQFFNQRFGEEKGEQIMSIVGHISGDGHYLFCVGMWLAPQPRFYIPFFETTFTFPILHYQLSHFHVVISLPFLIAFLGMQISAVAALSMKTSVTHHVEKITTSGIYGHVRHPQYLGHLIGYLGMSIFFSGVYAISFFPFLVVIVIFLGIAEERALVAQYGSAYREYQQEVPFLIPFVKMSE